MNLVASPYQLQDKTPEERRIRHLERTIGDLRHRIRELEGHLMPVAQIPVDWNLKNREIQVFRVLLGADVTSLERIAFALYADSERDVIPQTVWCHIHHLKKKLHPFGVFISHRRHVGYSLADRLIWKAKLS